MVHEGQRYKGDISIETIFGKCSVSICDLNEVPKYGMGKQKKSWVFFCRFALGPKNSREFISVKQSGMKQLADTTARTLVDSSASKNVNNNNNDLTTTPARATRSRKVSENEENDASVSRDIVNTPRSSTTTPARATRSRKVSENEENDASVSRDYVNTPRSSKRNRKTTSYLEDKLPSPLKNSTFSVSATKELRIVIHRYNNNSPKHATAAAETDESVKVKARKKLDLEMTPTKVSRYSILFYFLL